MRGEGEVCHTSQTKQRHQNPLLVTMWAMLCNSMCVHISEEQVHSTQWNIYRECPENITNHFMTNSGENMWQGLMGMTSPFQQVWNGYFSSCPVSTSSPCHCHLSFHLPDSRLTLKIPKVHLKGAMILFNIVGAIFNDKQFKQCIIQILVTDILEGSRHCGK